MRLWARPDAPIASRFFGGHDLPVIGENHARGRVSHFKGQLWRVLVLGKVIGSERVPKPVIRPLCESSGLSEKVDIMVIPPVAIGRQTLY